MKLCQNVCLDEISDEFEKWIMSVQMLGKPCVLPRGQIFSLIIMKLGQSVLLNEFSDELENGSCRVKD